METVGRAVSVLSPRIDEKEADVLFQEALREQLPGGGLRRGERSETSSDDERHGGSFTALPSGKAE
jgi:hypothetical protein